MRDFYLNRNVERPTPNAELRMNERAFSERSCAGPQAAGNDRRVHPNKFREREDAFGPGRTGVHDYGVMRLVRQHEA
jgi:hypothetical protein